MTTKQTAKLTALRAEAEMHGDGGTVALVDAALAGDTAARAKLGVAARAVKATAKCSDRKEPRQIKTYAHDGHPWAHDVE